MDKQEKESWCHYAERMNYYREGPMDGRWIRMNKQEILEYEEADLKEIGEISFEEFRAWWGGVFKRTQPDILCVKDVGGLDKDDAMECVHCGEPEIPYLNPQALYFLDRFVCDGCYYNGMD